MYRSGFAGRTVEWYIIENWFGTYPSPGDWQGRFYIDGGNYDVYRATGTVGQDQWFSVRETRRDSGTISYGQHFNKWHQYNGDAGISHRPSSGQCWLLRRTAVRRLLTRNGAVRWRERASALSKEKYRWR